MCPLTTKTSEINITHSAIPTTSLRVKIDACKLQVDFPGFDSKEHPLVKVVTIFYVECHQSSIFYLENAFRGGVSGREVSRREMQKKKSKKKTILHV